MVEGKENTITLKTTLNGSIGVISGNKKKSPDSFTTHRDPRAFDLWDGVQGFVSSMYVTSLKKSSKPSQND